MLADAIRGVVPNEQLNFRLEPDEKVALDAIVTSERARAARLGVSTSTITAGSVIRQWIRDRPEYMRTKTAPKKRK